MRLLRSCHFRACLAILFLAGTALAQIQDDETEQLWANPEARLDDARSIVVSTDIGQVHELRFFGNNLAFSGDPAPFEFAHSSGLQTIFRSMSPVDLSGGAVLDLQQLTPTSTAPETHVYFEFAEDNISSVFTEIPAEDFGTFFEHMVNLQLNVDNQFVLTGSNVELNGVEFRSASGGLLAGERDADSDPFHFFLSNDQNNITMGKLGPGVILDGSLVLNVGWNPEATTGDLRARWGMGEIPVNLNIPNDFYEICENCPAGEFATVPEPTGIYLATWTLSLLFRTRRRR